MLHESFVDYAVEVGVDALSLAQMIRQESIDLATSQLVMQGGEALGIALIGRRGWTSRLAAMGIRPEWRGQGIGRWFLQQLIAEARERGERVMVLEVIEQNEAGVRLYEGAGFQRVRRLVGYTARQPKGLADAHLQEVDLSEVARHLIRYGLPDLPWQISGETLAQTGLPTAGFQLGPAYAAISDPIQTNIFIRTLVVPPKAEHQRWDVRLLQALFARYPGRTWVVPLVYPEELSRGLFESLGFEREALTQLQMRLEIGINVTIKR